MRRFLGVVIAAGMTLPACSAAETPLRERSTVAASPARNGGTAPAGAPPSAAYDDPRAPHCGTLEPHGVVDGPLDADPEVAAAQQWRADMGLRSDSAWTRGAAANPGQNQWAHPITDAEHHELMGRNPPPELMGQLNGYAGEHPDTFAGRWLDHSQRALVAAFTDAPGPHQRELDRGLGPGRVRVRQASWSMADLDVLNRDTRAWVRSGELAYGWATRENLAVVEIDLYVRDEESVTAVADEFDGRPVCVERADPADVVPEGPQLWSGDGWRLLADQRRGRFWDVSAAQDEGAYAALWADLGLTGDRPKVDFTDEVVLHFGPAVSGSCPTVRLDEVVVDRDGAVVWPRIVLPGKQSVCNDDANPYTYLVAMRRAALPEAFTLQISENPPIGAAGARERVELRR